ncbi:MAG: nucleoside triphosphate pyrophosphohydrolase [Candidatus Pacebacteria bacterium]|nr:nucleoside triphosphate pyrophosphohydrolase [Candidatus Paceibacterota bacterium]
MKQVFNKLVRDRIPEKIEANGETCVTRVLDDDEYRIELIKKLEEEIIEVRLAADDPKELIEELADVFEVIDAIVKGFALDRAEIDQAQKKKLEKRGGFEQRIFLESTR